MIVSFFIKNYKSILEEKLDFRFAEGKAPNGYRDGDYHVFLQDKNVKCVPVLAILGANGSGKSNILRAIWALMNVVKNGISNNYFPNKLNDKYKSTTFTLEFVINGITYTYSISYDESKIEKESLKKGEKFLFNVTGVEVHSDLLKGERLDDIRKIFAQSCLDQKFFKKSLLLMVKTWLSGLNSDISTVYDYLVNSLVYGAGNSLPVPLSISMLSNSWREPEEAFREIVTYLQKMDLNVSDAQMILKRNWIKTEKYPDGREVSSWKDDVTVYHKSISGGKVGLKLSEESTGTQLLFGVLGAVLSALKKGQVLFIDELDRSLHPFILKGLVRLFKDKSINTTRAQLIYSTHDTSVLEDELLRISEAAFVSNTLVNGTKLKRLCDYGTVTNADNFRKMYVNCQLGSVPFTQI